MSNATDDARIAELRDQMTTKQFKLCEAILDGKKPSEAGRIAGYACESATSHALNNVKVSQYISLSRKKATSNAIMSREEVLRELAEIAKGKHTEDGKRDATGRTGAMREISKISGFYEPEKQEVTGSLVDRIRKGRGN